MSEEKNDYVYVDVVALTAGRPPILFSSAQQFEAPRSAWEVEITAPCRIVFDPKGVKGMAKVAVVAPYGSVRKVR